MQRQPSAMSTLIYSRGDCSLRRGSNAHYLIGVAVVAQRPRKTDNPEDLSH